MTLDLRKGAQVHADMRLVSYLIFIILINFVAAICTVPRDCDLVFLILLLDVGWLTPY